MSLLELAFSTGQLAALMRPKVAWLSATHPVVQESALLKSQPTAAAPTIPRPPSTPETLRETFDRHEQGETRVEPRRKLSEMSPLIRDLLLGGVPNALATAFTADPEHRTRDTLLSGVSSGLATAGLGHMMRSPVAPKVATDSLCTSCRKARHYGHCKRPIAIKKSNFNLGMTSDESTDSPSTSQHYHSATSADSSMARARDGRPADEQAATAFADLFRHLGITSQTDEPGRMYGGLNKVSQFMIRKAPAISEPEASQAVTRAFGQVDGATDSTCIEDSSAPSPGPSA